MGGECDRHIECMERIHESINKIEVENAGTRGQITGFVNSINEFITAIRKDVYSKDGLMDRVGKHGNQLSLQWGIVSIIIVGIIGACIAILFKK